MAKLEEVETLKLVKITKDVIEQTHQTNLKGKTGMIYGINDEMEIIIKIDRFTPLPFSLEEFELL